MAQQTNRYGALNADNSITYAPLSFKEGSTTWSSPTEARYRAHGYKPIVDNPPQQEGYYARRTDKGDEVDGRIVVRYEMIPLPPVVHTYKRSYLAQWLRANGKWPAFAALLAADDNLAFMWTYCTEFDDAHPDWEAALEGIASALSLTDEKVDEMLAYGETGGAQ